MALTVASFIITSAICSVIIYIVMWHWGRRRLYEMASKFQGPPLLPFIGNAHLFVGSTESLLGKLIKLYESYNPPFRIWLGPHLFVFVTDPEIIKVICLSPKALGKGVVAEFNRPLFGEGLLTAPVAKWKVSRKLIQPTFNPKILNSFVEILAAQSRIFTEQIERHLEGPEFEVFDLLSLCTLDMICETHMGVKIGSQIKGNFSFVKALKEAVASIDVRFCHFWLHPDFIFDRTELGKEQRKHNKFIHDFIDNVIKTRKSELLKRSSQADTADNEYDASESRAPRREAFLDHLMQLTSLSDQELREEVAIMVMAGIDTTALTLSSAMLMLASHPEVQEKAYQELWEIYGDSDVEERPVTAEDLPRMKYLERVLKETMRLFPTALMIFRFVDEDINIGDHTIPKGCSVMLDILCLHRNEKYWPDPLTFDPDRFLPEEVAKRHPYAYMAFSRGPRNCIGLNYALMSMKTMIATVLRRYVLAKDVIVPIKDIRLKLQFLLKIADPIKIRIKKRTR